MKTANNYTGLTVGSPLSTPTEINLRINGFLIKRVDLWEGNETGAKVRQAYEREKVKLEKFFEDLKAEITAELKEKYTNREVGYSDDFVYTGKTSAQWGGDGNSYKGIRYYFTTPSPSHEGDTPMLIWSFRNELGNETPQ